MLNQKLIPKLLGIIFIGIVIGLLGTSLITAQAQGTIPSWIKIVAAAWADGISSDQEFILAMEFLIEEGIFQITYKESTQVPIGAVIDWWRPDGSIPVPSGYKIANGANGTPDLIGKFVKGTKLDSIGQSGGSSTHSLIIDRFSVKSSSVSHNHQWSFFDDSKKAWYSFNNDGSRIEIVDWGNGMSNDGSGQYPVATSGGSDLNLYTTIDRNIHWFMYEPLPEKVNSLPPYVGLLKIMPDGSAIGNSLPIGAVIDWTPTQYSYSTPKGIPDGYVIADGKTVNDPQSPFNGKSLPDLREKFVMGVSEDKIGEIGVTSHKHNIPGIQVTTEPESLPRTNTVNHQWVDGYSHYVSWTQNGDEKKIISWDNGIGKDGKGQYPLDIQGSGSTNKYDHDHTVEIPSFDSSTEKNKIPGYYTLLKIIKIK